MTTCLIFVWEFSRKNTRNTQETVELLRLLHIKDIFHQLRAVFPPQNMDLMIPISHSQNKQTDAWQMSWYLSKYYLLLVLFFPYPCSCWQYITAFDPNCLNVCWMSHKFSNRLSVCVVWASAACMCGMWCAWLCECKQICAESNTVISVYVWLQVCMCVHVWAQALSREG